MLISLLIFKFITSKNSKFLFETLIFRENVNKGSMALLIYFNINFKHTLKFLGASAGFGFVNFVDPDSAIQVISFINNFF